MEYLKIKWKAKDKGTLKIPFEDLDLTMEEWLDMSVEEQEDLVRDCINSSDETIIYGEATSYQVIEVDD